MKKVTVVGAGLAGSECAWQLAEMGYWVDLYEQRDGIENTPAHKTTQLAELVCSNSLGSESQASASGQLKWEAERLNLLIYQVAKRFQVPAGQALAVDRDRFSSAITKLIEDHPRIQLHRKKINSFSEILRPAVICTGPLTSAELTTEMLNHFGTKFLYFFDAIAPIIDADSINYDLVWRQDRYDKGTPDYINCPLNKDQYFKLIDEITKADKVTPKEFEKTPFFEGCMPIEAMVERGPQTLRFGPLKPVGLTDPRTGQNCFAVVQLRQENQEASAYNLVGFQTRMTYSEQVRIFRMIPGLENAEFLKLGSLHRNLFLNSPTLLNKDLSSHCEPSLFFSGLLTGVEGYFESAAIGFLSSLFIHQKFEGFFLPPPRETALGSLHNYLINDFKKETFKPTNINLSLFPSLDKKISDKSLKKKLIFEKAQNSFKNWQLNYLTQPKAPALQTEPQLQL